VVRYTFIVVDFHLLLLAGLTGASLELAQTASQQHCSKLRQLIGVLLT